MAGDVAALWASYAPRIAEARRTDAKDADEAFLTFSREVCGYQVEPLTVGRFLILQSLENAFVGEGDVGPSDVATFLWVCSKKFDPNPRKGKRFVRRFPQKRWHLFVPEIVKHLEQVTTQSAKNEKSEPGAWLAALVDVLASEYGWSLSQIYETPLAVVFQLAAKIRGRNSQGAPISFSPRADALQAEFLKAAKEAQA